MKTDVELKKIAIDIAEDKIFTDRYVDSPNLLSIIFMPLIAMKLTKEQADDIGLIYEYYDKAGPRAINGYPIFMSFGLLTKEEVKKVIDHIDDYKSMKDQFLKEQ